MNLPAEVLVPDEVSHIRVLPREEALAMELALVHDDMRDAASQLEEIGGAAGEVGRFLRSRAQTSALRAR